jgi:hypothetical protein
MKKTIFRINAKRIYLTYSQVNKEMQLQDVLQALKNKKLFVFKHLISKEHHQDGETHFHVMLEATNKFSLTRQDFLDITYQEKSYHGNYQPVKSAYNTVEYICKAGDYITDFTNIQHGKLMSTKQLLIQSALETGVNNALLQHCKHLPEKALNTLSLVGVKAFFQAHESLKQTKDASKLDSPFKLKDFNLKNNPEILRWIQHPEKTLVLTGPSGVGKTQFAKAFAQEKGFETLVVNHLEGFKDLTSRHDCIILDDANITGLDPTQLLALVDNQQHKTLRVLYGTVNKRKGLIQMFTMNKREFYYIKPFLKEKRFARRMVFSEVKQPIINLYVNIKVHNGDVNNNFSQVSSLEQKLVQENIQRIEDCI